VEPAVELERQQVRLQVHALPAYLEPQQRVVEHGARVVAAGRGPGQQVAGLGVAQVLVGVAADLVQVGIRRFGDRQVEVLPQQMQQFGAPVGLRPGLERVAAGQGELGLAERGREPGVGGDLLLVHARRVHHRPAGAPGVAGQRGDRAGVVVARRDRAPDPVKPGLGAVHCRRVC
jgi:hypothetical protein